MGKGKKAEGSQMMAAEFGGHYEVRRCIKFQNGVEPGFRALLK